MADEPNPRSGFSEYIAAIQGRTFRPAVAAAARMNLGELAQCAQDQMWRDAAAKIGAEDNSQPVARPVTLRKPSRNRGGRPRQWFQGSDWQEKQRMAEEIAGRELGNGKSPRDVSDMLAVEFPGEWKPERRFVQKLEQFQKSPNRAKTRGNS